MDMTAFLGMFPEQAARETRSVTTTGHPLLPDDDYGLLEFYCTAPSCDCRMVMLQVRPASNPNRNLASICYGFDQEDELKEPILDFGPPASKYANILLELVKPILADPIYAARLESHYNQVKQAKGSSRRSLPTKPKPAGLEQFKPNRPGWRRKGP